MNRVMLLGLLLLLLIGLTSGGRILALLPHFGLTHWMVFRPLVEELAGRGHDVTVVSPFPRKTPMKNYRDVSLEGSYPKTTEYVNFTDMENVYRFSVMEMYPLLYMARMTEGSFEQGDVLALARGSVNHIRSSNIHSNRFHSRAVESTG